MRWTCRLAAFLCAVLLATGLLAPGATAHEKEVEGPEIGGDAPGPAAFCESGAADLFPCENVDLLAWLPPAVFVAGRGNDVWGWTDPRSGREYALVGFRRGTAFVDISEPTEPVYLGMLRSQTVGSTWRDIKTYAGHAFIVSEARNHGLQIFDLSQLAGVTDPPVTFTPTAHYPFFGNAHNLAIDEATGMAFAVGTGTCAGGLHMVDVSRPTAPVFAGCFSGDGYTHDAQCVVYRGPDLEHLEREICFGSNEDTVTIVDVTSRDAPLLLSRTGYPNSAYTHQGWLTEDHRYFLLGDELDEGRFGHNARTYVWDVSDLEAPFIVGHYTSPQHAIDHNVFVVGNHVFEANYRSGLRVLRMGDLSRAEMTQVGFFDTYPEGDGLSFSGAWGVYPFFESGVVVVSDINRGLFVLKPDLLAVPECSDGIDNDADGLTDYAEDPSCEGPGGAREAPRSDVAISVRTGHPSKGPGRGPRGLARVAVLGSPGFEVSAVDAATLRLHPFGSEPRFEPRLRDVNRDGFVDLVALYRLGGDEPSGEGLPLCLAWQTHDGTLYEGCQARRRVPAHTAPSLPGYSR